MRQILSATRSSKFSTSVCGHLVRGNKSLDWILDNCLFMWWSNWPLRWECVWSARPFSLKETPKRETAMAARYQTPCFVFLTHRPTLHTHHPTSRWVLVFLTHRPTSRWVLVFLTHRPTSRWVLVRWVLVFLSHRPTLRRVLHFRSHPNKFPHPYPMQKLFYSRHIFLFSWTLSLGFASHFWSPLCSVTDMTSSLPALVEPYPEFKLYLVDRYNAVSCRPSAGPQVWAWFHMHLPAKPRFLARCPSCISSV